MLKYKPLSKLPYLLCLIFIWRFMDPVWTLITRYLTDASSLICSLQELEELCMVNASSELALSTPGKSGFILFVTSKICSGSGGRQISSSWSLWLPPSNSSTECTSGLPTQANFQCVFCDAIMVVARQEFVYDWHLLQLSFGGCIWIIARIKSF